MYSVITYYIVFKAIDTVIQGLDETKDFIIVSYYNDDVLNAIWDHLGRGTTKLKSIVHEINPNAFITIMNTQETKGAKFNFAIH